MTLFKQTMSLNDIFFEINKVVILTKTTVTRKHMIEMTRNRDRRDPRVQ